MDQVHGLKQILGANLLTSREQKIPFQTDASYFQGQEPLAVALPENVKQVREVIKFCQEHSIPVVVRGGGTALTGSSIPFKDFIVLSMAKFDKIIEVKPEDRYAIVEPGVKLDALNQYLANFGHFYPPDPASSMAASVGGSISTNAGGLRASLYGTTRNWVLGLEVVLPNGEIVKVGGKVLKRTAGYDLTSMFVGAEGTLGVVTKAILKIWPLPESKGRILAYYDTIDKVGKAISKLKGKGITPLIAEFLDRISMDSLSKTRGLKFPDEVDYMLIVDLSSTRESIDRELSDAAEVLKEFGPVSIKITTDPTEMDRIYEARKGAYSSLLSERESNSERVVIGDIVVPASELSAALKESEEKVKEHHLKVALFGHISDGNIHANIYADLDNREHMERIDRFQIDFGKIAIKHGGSVSAEHGIGIEKKELLEMELEETGSQYTMEIMKTIRKAFDPNGIMNRGKMFD
ncbi:MAG: FAD-binding oxidoreductase [Candidatus Thermoplasmatota archaeon]|nr:FAD-binding oxidoreductase [Candidatus Thermoplasmatota archaeon]MDA8143730.1 FAD-binding oxidoreductase [Thermoplasmatales archaeon]